jgi:hypothetical protein
MATSIQELSLDNNAIAKDKNYRRNVLANFTGLKKLDTKRVSVNFKTQKSFCLIPTLKTSVKRTKKNAWLKKRI